MKKTLKHPQPQSSTPEQGLGVNCSLTSWLADDCSPSAHGPEAGGLGGALGVLCGEIRMRGGARHRQA